MLSVFGSASIVTGSRYARVPAVHVSAHGAWRAVANMPVQSRSSTGTGIQPQRTNCSVLKRHFHSRRLLCCRRARAGAAPST